MKKWSEFLSLRERCWPGYKSVPGKKAYSPGSCMKEEDMEEGWSQKYKSSIDCSHPKGFSQKAHCAGKKKNEDVNESAAAAIAAATAIAKKKSGNYDEKGFRKTPYKNPDHPNRKSNTEREAELKEDLRKWFSKTDPAGDWKRINSKGEAIGPCAREPGEPKPKCMSRAKRNSLTKKERASAVRAKRKNDPNPERQGKPINVSNFGKGKISETMENLDEKNVPTSPEKWAQAKSQAKAKFDVYPSAYANGWASKKYKAMGGGWKSVSEENNLLEKWSQLGEEQHKEIDTHTEVEDGSHQDKNDTKDLHDRVKAAAKKHGATITYQDKPSLRGSHTISARGSQDFHKEVKHIASDYEHLGVQHDINEGAVPAQEKIITVKHKTSGKTLRISAAAAAKYRMQGYHYHPVNEAKDEQEYGYEGDMALNQLATLIRCGEMIKDLLKPNTDLPEWVQSKITLATDYIQTAADYMYSEMKESNDSDGGPPTEAAATLTVTGQPKLNKTVGQSKLIPYVQENKETKPPFDKPYTTTKAVVKDKSGAKHTPMSRARDLARKAMARKMEEQSNIEPNPFTIPSSNPGDAPEKKVKKASPVAPTAMAESRQLEIVREAMKVAKKKKEVTEAGTDKFIADPELSSQITKSNP